MIDLRDDLVAALAGRYDIERELGHGGMAIVYLARDVRHGRHVAVKALRPELATTLGAERFLREINIAARLAHPNILALHDSGEAAGMLYFVMPYVEGETLRDRLDREHQLPIEEALSITRQVGLALDYAHDHGVIHRDIKPENILLVGDHVLIADFGLGRALYRAGTQRLTESAVAVGTPAYMSPEQAAADPEVDGRTDIYSLACVLYEMVAGMPPFKGATAAALLAQHLTATPPSICAQRPHCPPNVDEAVARALEKTPADRFRTARDFVAALTAPPVVPSPARHTPVLAPGVAVAPEGAAPARRERAVPLVLLTVVGAGVAIAAAIALAKGRGAPTQPVTDRDSYVVLPLTASDPAARADTAALTQRVADALGEWNGVRVLESRAVTDQLALVRRGGPLRLDDALGIAAALGAAKLVWGEVGAGGAAPGARTARLTLYDVATGTPLHPSTMAYAAGGPSAADLRLTASSLLRGTGESPWKGRSRGHPSLAAWLAYDAGRAAIARWDIADAMRALRTATTIDPSHAPANLWLSLAEMWSGLPADQWRGAVRRAHEQRDQLDPGDTALATAQLALAEDNYPAACAAYQRVIRTDTTGVIGWYGLGECQSRDSLVVRDPAARGGWRFRGDMNRAIHAYLAIVDGRGPPQPAFVYSRLAQLLPTAANHLRRGYSAGQDRLEFGAFAAFDGDTLGFVPFPLGDKGAAGGARFAAASARAIDHSRALLRRLYAPWAATAPATVEAHVTLASYLETLEDIGDSETNPLSALGQIRRAHLLSSDPAEQRALARTELRLLVKNADWSHAARLADSLFAASPHPITDSTLAGAAALTGRISTLAAILRAWGGAPTFSLSLPNGTPLDLSPALAQDAAGTFAFALTGACVEALRGYRQRLDRQLASYVPDPAQRIIVRGVLLRRPLSVGMPCVGAGALAGIDPAGDRMVMLEQAFAAHDTARVRAIYAALMNARALSRPGDTSMDYTFMESWILAAIGDTTEATTHLDRSLEALPTLGVYFLNFPAHAAALVRAMGLRAELAAAAGDQATAARWAGAVATLWANADPELQPYVQRMQALAGRDRSGATGDRER